MPTSLAPRRKFIAEFGDVRLPLSHGAPDRLRPSAESQQTRCTSEMDTLLRHFSSSRFHLREIELTERPALLLGIEPAPRFRRGDKSTPGECTNFHLFIAMSFKDVGLRLEPQTLLVHA
jgi:hypothetical protein